MRREYMHILVSVSVWVGCESAGSVGKGVRQGVWGGVRVLAAVWAEEGVGNVGRW